MSDTKYVFLKWGHKFAYGGRMDECSMLPEEYKNDKELFEEWLESKAEEYSWSDKYRGIDYEWIDFPDDDWIKKQINRHKSSISSAEKLINSLKDIMREKDAASGHHSV